ncbi:AraC family transcriptional regulator [Agrobacterium tumefaciens]|uniref:AraC family transcriptional regulator n=1 Tax=Agrobacterium tumefaciens TaxID=358 RepID=UPI001ADA51F3|nr:AraC family transcriptional regulator [Agrobacterium tumefaciens]QTK81661.1 AraC family transcriptional regulator [Agrobacterium tumefaciens]
MADPVAEVVSLLKPIPSISKLVTGGGQWLVERTELGSPFYCAVVEGRCLMTFAGHEPMVLTAGDFVLVPKIFSFTMSSMEPPPRGALAQRLETSPGVFRLGDPEARSEVKALVGHCAFGSDDKALLVSLLPEVIHVHGEERLMALVLMINEETRADRVAREMVLHRLLEVLFIDALRSAASAKAPPGLLRGMADPLAPTLRRIHQDPGRSMTVETLAREAAMSRSTFFDRFRKEVGVAPMEYATGWRMALAKEFLRKDMPMADIAQRVGYGSTSAFSVAFNRHVGMPPGAYSRAVAAAA